MNNLPAIELEQVTKIYQTQPRSGVESVSLSIEKGTINVIAGASGSGKSTLLKLIAGLLTPDSGEIRYLGKRVLGPTEKLIPGHEAMKVVAQDFNLNIYAKVYDNIAGLLSNTDLKGKQRKTLEVMEFLRIDHLAQKRAVDLSGGEQQRVAIARAIITGPEVLLLDEPFSQVDAMFKNELRADIRRMATYLGITVVLVSHDPVDGLSMADKMMIIKDGNLVEEGSPHSLYNRPKELYTATLLTNCNVLSADEARVIGIHTNKDQVVIYPEWIDLAEGGQEWRVKERLFKGFYEEILLEYEGVELRALNTEPGLYKTDSIINSGIRKFREY
ncbi:ABC-type Fe3+/spermidine/putrescine transport system ATPase subunit [Arcticibacter pallidicorallinus]|uniref:ABC-type Fe3+/spermidine/putrescine transport system ATPase subunit n=1 Tax=Arcticibacter pallidicorallinus TaxID=1259464 RepID=A0A2T0UAZ8_9SPHI|nr:ABC transporter ATP-binding protein [Arcticibacter pallidicorallinus]PRY55064.1 ABC-type Fe3+/spermidine/putrescine transport system ATPase subunit [Arcticibacter pallidicorallinus]